MTRPIAILTGLALSSILSFAESPDRWNGLVLNESTAEDAIKVLGSPKKIETSKLRVSKIESLLVDDYKRKVFRVLEWSNLEGFKSVVLAFKDNKLISVELSPDKHNKIPADDLAGLYDSTSFQIPADKSTGTFGVSSSVSAVTESPLVDILGMAAKSYVIVCVSKNPGAVFNANHTPGGPSPGDVYRIQLVSRTLEKPN